MKAFLTSGIDWTRPALSTVVASSSTRNRQSFDAHTCNSLLSCTNDSASSPSTQSSVRVGGNDGGDIAVYEPASGHCAVTMPGVSVWSTTGTRRLLGDRQGVKYICSRSRQVSHHSTTRRNSVVATISHRLRKINSIVDSGTVGEQAGNLISPRTRLLRRQGFNANLNHQHAGKHYIVLTEDAKSPILPQRIVSSALQLDGRLDDKFTPWKRVNHVNWHP